MSILKQVIEQKIQAAFVRAFPTLGADFQPTVTRATQDKFGHYQCNSAMALAKQLSSKPRSISESAVVAMQEDGEGIFEKIEVAGPGFINIWLSSEFLNTWSESLLTADSCVPQLSTGARIIVDFSSPNIAKEMHVGHLRSTIIGDAIARLFEAMGASVLRLNHVGDWGTAFGMLIAYCEQHHPDFMSGKTEADLTDLVGWYRRSKALFDEDSEFKKRSQARVVALQSGEKAIISAWERICSISEKAYQQIYDLLNVDLNTRGESFYNPYLAGIIDTLDKKSLLTTSEGAKCVYLEGFIGRDDAPLPLIVQKSDGGYNYASTDLAAIEHRVSTEKAERVIYVTDGGQALHFNMVFSCAEKAGLVDRKTVRLDHVPFGLVLGADGKKFKTRSGETERLIDLLTNAIQKAKSLIDERELDLSAADKDQLALRLGIGAVKYADLCTNRTSDYQFSYERMLRFEGNTAAFLLYSYVRTQSILRKVQASPESIMKATFQIQEPAEVALAVHCAQFAEACVSMADDLLPSKLADYLYGLATLFNQFFRDCRVAGAPEQEARLKLCALTGKILSEGLQLLGLQTAERM